LKLCTFDEAVALIRPRDLVAGSLGPGEPSGVFEALGRRDDWEDLVVFASLLTNLYAVFAKPGVRLLSAFYGPVERMLREAGHAVEFVPGDFRRFSLFAEKMAPRVMATTACPPDADGMMSLSLHAGATVKELRRCGKDPDRLLIVEANSKLPHTLGLPPAHPHALHVDEVDVGDPFPGYALQDQDGAVHEVASHEKRAPTLYIFYRGHW
jgi:hypothetical protein